MKLHIPVLLCGTLLLSGCHIYGKYERPKEISAEGLYRDTATGSAMMAQDTSNLGNIPWQEIFTEPELQTLIQTALEKNADLRSADLTVTQAQAGLKVARLSYLPSLAFSPNGTISSFDGSKATKAYSLPVQASWQIDAFGSIRNQKKQAEMQVLQAKAGKQAVRTSIIAAVANLYYTLQMLDEQLATSKSTLELWKRNVEVMEAMWQAGGLTNSAAVAQAKANYYQLEGTIPVLEQSMSSAENALCVLLHEAPHAIKRGKFNGTNLPEDISVGVPLQLLSNRSDVKAAEYQLAEAFYATNAARSAFYPQITLSGSAGWTNNVGVILNPAKFLASAVGSLTQPLFAKGQLTANLKINKARQEAAQLNFEKSLLTAGQEVSDALGEYQTYTEKEAFSEKQVEQLENAVEATQDLFTHGRSTSYLETLTAQQSLLQAKLNLISDRFDKVQSVISLYQALGGGREM